MFRGKTLQCKAIKYDKSQTVRPETHRWIRFPWLFWCLLLLPDLQATLGKVVDENNIKSCTVKYHMPTQQHQNKDIARHTHVWKSQLLRDSQHVSQNPETSKPLGQRLGWSSLGEKLCPAFGKPLRKSICIYIYIVYIFNVYIYNIFNYWDVFWYIVLLCFNICVSYTLLFDVSHPFWAHPYI